MAKPGRSAAFSTLADTLRNKLAGEDLMVLPPGGVVWKPGGDNAAT